MSFEEKDFFKRYNKKSKNYFTVHISLSWNSYLFLQQTTEQSYPELLLIAINKRGVSLIDTKTKDVSSNPCLVVLKHHRKILLCIDLGHIPIHEDK